MIRVAQCWKTSNDAIGDFKKMSPTHKPLLLMQKAGFEDNRIHCEGHSDRLKGYFR